jgi:hypothetical protein
MSAPSVACIVDCLLKSANVDDLPVEQATKFDLVINLNIAKALGVTIPSSLLAHLRLSFSRAASSGCNQWCRGQRSVSNFRAFKRSDLNLAAVHRRYWPKADMTSCGNPHLRSLLGAKRTWVGALHMSAFDPKRTSCCVAVRTISPPSLRKT